MLLISSALLELGGDAIPPAKKIPVSLSRKPCRGRGVEEVREIAFLPLSSTPVYAGINTSNNNNVQDRQELRVFLEFIGF
jgi:hypothetical protein